VSFTDTVLIGSYVYQPIWVPEIGKWRLVQTDHAGKVQEYLTPTGYSFRGQAITELHLLKSMGKLGGTYADRD
jgi:hypothetical protein